MGSTISKKKNTTTTKTNKVTLKDYISWFEIPAYNFEQAVSFYNHIYDINMEKIVTNGYAMAFFPTSTGIGGAVVVGPGSVPSDTGPLLYMNGGQDLNHVLKNVGAAGGRIVLEKTPISGDAGYFAIFIDCEGNKLALHSKN